MLGNGGVQGGGLWGDDGEWAALPAAPPGTGVVRMGDPEEDNENWEAEAEAYQSWRRRVEQGLEATFGVMTISVDLNAGE